jgi:hypothetical protein
MRAGASRADRRRPLIARAFAGVVCAVAFVLAAPLPGVVQDARAASLGRGIIDYRLEESFVDLNAVPAMVAEMGPDRLRSRWTRVMIHWATMQPVAPGTAYGADADGDGYADAYVDQLTVILDQLSAAGMQIVLTPVDTPKWAVDSSWESRPPPGYQKNKYYPFYAPDMDSAVVKGQFAALGAYLAGKYAGRARFFECWNEPNQGFYLYPQTPASVTKGGGAIYLKMLKAWYAGVKKGSSSAVVIGGATAPRGRGDLVSTPPRAFARYLKDKGAGAYMDAYSHHPYTPGGSTRVRPGEMPNNSARAVTLGNLGQLTKLFPKKPFYLTEFGYHTQYSHWFGVAVSKADQARYLRQAYAYAQRYRQVKALLWFMVDDYSPGGSDKAGDGIYMGVRTSTGVRKPSWYAFAGGSALTLTVPAGARAGAPFTLSGALMYRSPEAPATQVLTLQWRAPNSATWHSSATIHSAADGTYSRTLKQPKTRLYRVVWGGVCESPTRTVKTP